MAAKMQSFVRISALLWADILVAYAIFVMQNYLTNVWELSFTHAAGVLNIWGGICMILPVFFLFLVDAALGNFTMLVISSITYSVGIGFVTMSTPSVLANSTGTCKQYESECIGHTQKALFYTGMALLTVGISGNVVSVRAFLKEQKGEKTLGQVVMFIPIVTVPVVGAIAIPYVKPWTTRFGIAAICTLVATLGFLSGWGTYDKVKPEGSPLTNVCRVFVASAFKRSEQFPDDANQIHKKAKNDSFTQTRILRCLEKAAIELPGEDEVNNRWRLCYVSDVEEAKIVVRMVPMWLTFIVIGIVSSIGSTYFVEQANHMNRKLGTWELTIPVLKMLFDIFKAFFEAFAKKFLAKSKKYAPSAGIAVAMIFSILCCITAAKIEEKRLNVIRKHDLLDKPEEEIPMSVFWLLLQFFLLGGLDAFFEKSVAEFYNYQAPKSMRNYLGYFTKGVSGLGYMFSVLSVYVVGKVSEKGGRTNWFQYTLNRSRLDRYFWVLATLSSVNLFIFICVASGYRYKKCEEQNEEVAGVNVELPFDGNGEAGLVGSLA